MSPDAVAACHLHPRRNAVGICIDCRVQVCGECVTKVDGINFCVRCYELKADEGVVREAKQMRSASRGLAWLAFSLSFGLAVLLVRWSLAMALPGAG